MARDFADAVVVGGGIVGCAVAYALAREGRSVVLVERGAVGSEASGAAAGMLAPLAEAHLEGATRRVGLEALEELPRVCEELRERTGLDPEWEASGLLRVAANAEEEARLRSSVRPGDAVEWLASKDAQSLVPGLALSSEGALWSPSEGHVSAPALTRAFAAAARGLGVRVREGVPVRSLIEAGGRIAGVRTSTEDLHAAETIVCTGAWAGGPGLGFSDSGLRLPSLPVEPLRGQAIALCPVAEVGTPGPRPIVWGPGAYLVPKRDGRVVVGATVERVGFDARTTAEGVRGLIEAAGALVPALGRAELAEAWAGLRPGSPDGLPAIGRPSAADGLIVAAGHHRNGILLSWTTARWVAALVSGKALPPDAAAFGVERFEAPHPDAFAR